MNGKESISWNPQCWIPSQNNVFLYILRIPQAEQKFWKLESDFIECVILHASQRNWEVWPPTISRVHKLDELYSESIPPQKLLGKS